MPYQAYQRYVVVFFNTLFCHFQTDLIQSDPEIPSLTLTTQILTSLTRSQTCSDLDLSDSESDSESEDDFNPFGGSGSDSDDGECRRVCVYV